MTRPVPGTDAPEILAVQRRLKHKDRVPQVFRPASPLTPLQQADAAAQRLLHAALVKAWGRKVADTYVREWELK